MNAILKKILLYSPLSYFSFKTVFKHEIKHGDERLLCGRRR